MSRHAHAQQLHQAELPARAGHMAFVPSAVRHASSVATPAASTEVQEPENTGSNAVQSLDVDALICEALRLAGLTHVQACAYMAGEDGKPLDFSQWTRMRTAGNLPIGRMRNLPLAFWQRFIPLLAEPAGVIATCDDLAELTVLRVITKAAELQREASELLTHLIARAQRRVA